MRKWADALPMPIAYFQLALRELGPTPQDRSTLSEGTGVSPDETSADITLGQQMRLIRNLNALRPPGWALQVGALFDASTHGPVAFASISAPTLADSLAVIARYAHVRAPWFRFDVRRDARRFTLRVDERVELADEERVPMLEMLLLAIQNLVERVYRLDMRQASFDFAYPSPPYADEYAACFHGPVRFDAADTALSLPAGWLGLKSPLADPVMYEASVRKLDTLARGLDADDYLVTRVEQLVASSRDAGPSLEAAARRLHVSGRTLVRRLQRAGTTYRELVDAQRRERAEALLRDPHLDVAEISHALGYGDPANFGRACRRWFGAAPSAYRKRLIG